MSAFVPELDDDPWAGNEKADAQPETDQPRYVAFKQQAPPPQQEPVYTTFNAPVQQQEPFPQTTPAAPNFDEDDVDDEVDLITPSSNSVQAEGVPPPPVTRYSRALPEDCPYKTITVTEPEKLTEGGSTFMSYKVSVFLANDNGAIISRRRFRDFYWLATELAEKYPGVIVPPCPEKKEIGKFKADFIEYRRGALESMLRRMVRHPILVSSPDLRMFLETENLDPFSQRQRRASTSNKSLLGMIGGAIVSPFIKSLSDEDPWFEQRKKQLETLDSQLRQLFKRVESIVKQRKELGSAVSSFWDSVSKMGNGPEVLHPIFTSLSHLGEIQQKVEDVHQRQSSQYVTQFGNTVEEYIRLLQSLRLALAVRDRYQSSLKEAKANLSRKQQRQESLVAANKGDQVMEVTREISELQTLLKTCQQDADEISTLLKEELQRFDENMTLDFQGSMKTFVTTMMDSQKEIMSWWDTYLPELQTLKVAM